MRRRSLLILVFAVSVLKAAPLPEATPMPTPPMVLTWPLPTQEYFVGHLPAPPRAGSFRDRLDVEDAVARQANLTPAQLQHIQFTYNFNVFTFSEVLGPSFNAKSYPQTAAFFQKVINEANFVVGELKNFYKRPRPFAAHPKKITLLVPNEPGYSYPSGHTTRSRLCAFFLSNLDPTHRMAFERSAEQVGIDRIMAGEHYQTDLEAGRKLARFLYRELMRDEEFLATLEAVRAAEWNASPAASPGVSPIRKRAYN